MWQSQTEIGLVQGWRGRRDTSVQLARTEESKILVLDNRNSIYQTSIKRAYLSAQTVN